MNAILYATIFIIGTLFGSFFTLAVYRIPRKKDITHTHSFCPNCNHKLGFFELIPILSYIFLGGKCKSCKQKIRPRYLIFEIASGITFIIFAYIFGLDAKNYEMKTIINFILFVLYLCAIFIIAGISKESKTIEKSVLYYGVTIGLAYIIYLYIIDVTSIYRYGMYLIVIIALLIVDLIQLKKNSKNNAVVENLLLVVVMALFTGEFTTSITILTVILCYAIIITKKYMVNKLKKVKKEKIELLSKVNIPFCLCIFNVIDTIVINLILKFLNYSK